MLFHTLTQSNVLLASLSSVEALLFRSSFHRCNAQNLTSFARWMIPIGKNRGRMTRCNCQNTGECSYHNEQQGWHGSNMNPMVYKSLIVKSTCWEPYSKPNSVRNFMDLLPSSLCQTGKRS